jgi:hypothetical protein
VRDPVSTGPPWHRVATKAVRMVLEAIKLLAAILGLTDRL